ncbi:MAG TPA: LPS-assembly protein LptD [Xanthobacteraceae bacterium]
MAGSTSRRPSISTRAWHAAGALAFACAWLAAAPPAAAQQEFLTFKQQIRPAAPQGPSLIKKGPQGDAQMLVKADEINYDTANHLVAAVGNVQIYYNGATIEADRVVYDQNTKRLRAEGNARLTEADGKITYGEILDFTDDYRDGFVDSLRLETADETRMAATRANRSSGNFTVFENGVYTACEPCKDDPKKPPLWQVKAARIIHNQVERMVYFEDARLEFFGVPVGYFPYLATPDPTVKRKTGLLMPVFSTSSTYGFGVETPYYFALAPNYDLTISPRFTTTQGVLLQSEFRHRLEDGSYTIKAAGIWQLDPGAFAGDPGDRQARGYVESSGKFNLTSNWTWGWDAIALTDSTFLSDYKIQSLQDRNPDPFGAALTSGVSQLWLTGRGTSSFFEARTMYFKGLTTADVQGELPVILPVIDYTKVFDQRVLGGEVGINVNFTSLSRDLASYDAISNAAVSNGLCTTATADPSVKVPANCLLRGVPGTYTRFTAEASWKRQFIDAYGQIFTPFASLRVDVAQASIENQVGVSNYIQTGTTDELRVMPTVGLEYRYPFIAVQSWGTQTIEPIAQVIVRPNEPNIGRLPNEDSQSLVFDDSNLFKVDKFAGYDRVEGGGRTNYGIQYTAQFNRGGSINALFGQSYQMFGANSFAVGDTTNTGLDSGLDTQRSDYVARVTYQPNRIYSFTSRFRFDQNDFTLKRLEVEGTANFDRWRLTMMYGDYAAQPELGFLTRREGVLAITAYKINPNWVVSTGLRYDIEAGKFDQTRIGIGYIDDCYMLSLNYIGDFTANGNLTANNTVMLQMSLRTLGGTGGTGAQ